MRITPRQQQVIDLMLRGYSVKQIARQLDISPRTVDDHIHAAYKTYGVTNRYGLIATLTAKGLPCPCCGRAAQ